LQEILCKNKSYEKLQHDHSIKSVFTIKDCSLLPPGLHSLTVSESINFISVLQGAATSHTAYTSHGLSSMELSILVILVLVPSFVKCHKKIWTEIFYEIFSKKFSEKKVSILWYAYAQTWHIKNNQ